MTEVNDMDYTCQNEWIKNDFFSGWMIEWERMTVFLFGTFRQSLEWMDKGMNVFVLGKPLWMDKMNGKRWLSFYLENPYNFQNEWIKRWLSFYFENFTMFKMNE